MQTVDQHRWSDLPRQTESVLEPTALRLFTAISGEFLPKIIHFFLRLAVHDERDRFIEFELRSAVQSDELLAFELELNRQHRSRRPPARFGRLLIVAEDSPDLRVLEDRRVKLHRFFGLLIEPQKWSDFLHWDFFWVVRLVWYLGFDKFR